MDMCKPQNYLERWELNALGTIYQISIYIYKSTCVVWLSNYMTKLHQILRTWEGWMHAGSGIPSQREYGIYEMGEMMISLYGWQICYMCKSSNLTYHPTLMTIYSGRIWMCDSVTLNIILPDVTFLAVQNCCHIICPLKNKLRVLARYFQTYLNFMFDR